MKFNLKKIIFILLLVFAIGKVHPVRGTNASIFTISVWVKPSGSAVSKAILGKSEELRLATNASSQPVCQIKSSSTWQTAATSSVAISVGSWSHVSCTYDLAYVRIYVNGVEKGSQALAVAADDTAAVWKIGRDDSASTPYGYFAGQIDEYKFYNSALTPDQIALDMNGGKELQLGGQTSATGATGQAAEYCVPGDATSCAGPVGEWKFDEKTGGSVNDTSGNGNVGTFGTAPASPTWTRGKYGGACQFDGTDDYVNMGDPSSGIFDFGLNNFALSAWFKTSATSDSVIFSKGNAVMSNYYVSITNGSVRVIYKDASNNGVDTTVGSGFNNGQWHHLVYNLNKSNNVLQIFVDGKQAGSDISVSTMTGGISNGYNLLVGEYYIPLNRFDGLIDEVKIFNYARTPAQIAWDYNRGKPVGWWKLDEGEGDKAYDSSGNGNLGTLTTMDPPNDWVTGKYGKALDFDGSSDRVVTGNVALVAANSQTYNKVSWGGWLKPTSSAAWKEIFNKNNEFKMSTDGNGNASCSIYSSGWQTAVVSSLALSLDTWQHVMCDYDGTNLKVYINGIEKGTGGENHNVTSTNATNIKIAQHPFDPSGGYFLGQIDDVRVYNYALTQEQVKQVINEGSVVRFGE